MADLYTDNATDLATARAALGIGAANGLIPILRKMSEGINNVTILECSDSTDYESNNTGSPYAGQKFFQWLLDQYTNYSGKKYTNVGSSGTWPTAVDVYPGRVKTAYYFNAALPSTNAYYFYGQYFEATYGLSSQPAPAPDLVIFNHGKNNDYTQVESVHVAMYLAQMQQLALRYPNAGMLAYVQIPNRDDNNQDVKARALRIAAGIMGVTVADHYADYSDYVNQGGSLSDLMFDAIHQNQVGDDRRFEVIKRLAKGRIGQFTPLRVSLNDRVTNLLQNGNFASYTTSAFDNWTGTNVTQTAETTNHESGTQAAFLTNPATGISSISQSLPASELKRHIGKFMTLAARVRIPAGAGQTESTMGCIQLSNGVDNYRTWGLVQNADSRSKDGYFWVATSGLIRSTSTGITVTLFVNNNASTASGKQVIFDRAILVQGNAPKDMI